MLHILSSAGGRVILDGLFLMRGLPTKNSSSFVIKVTTGLGVRDWAIVDSSFLSIANYMRPTVSEYVVDLGALSTL